MDALQKKIEALSQERIKIDEEIKGLQRQRNEDLLQALDTLPMASIDIATLIGGIQFIIQTASCDASLKEEWQQAGQTFCKALPSQKNRKAAVRSQKTSPEKE